MVGKVRLDHLLVQRGLAETGSQAQALIMTGAVLVGGQAITKPGTRVQGEAKLELLERLPYVSRGGVKLAAALDAFGVLAAGMVCADVGSSTGGFTDCLLQRGAARVYAIDVGYGQLAWSLRQDPRVVVMERTNARYLETLPETMHLVVIDVSFISLARILPTVTRWLAPPAHVIPLVKPQFEAGREQVPRGGVVRDATVHRQVLERVAHEAQQCGLAVHGVVRSPISGPAGNTEFLLHLRQSASPAEFVLGAAIEATLEHSAAAGSKPQTPLRPTGPTVGC
jgi:23S rRNA (cytidine1920-2'-O)/16S rRNA (cytidine1409-2'-O)-methyltransferase